MIIVRIETDIVPCAPRQLFRTRLPGSFFTQTPPLVETLAGAFGYVSALRRSQDVMDKKDSTVSFKIFSKLGNIDFVMRTQIALNKTI